MSGNPQKAVAWFVLLVMAGVGGWMAWHRVTESPLADAGVALLFAARLDDANGRPQALAQWRTQALVVNFWATWCPPCRDELPELSRLSERYAARRVQFVGIAVDSARNVGEFARNRRVGFPLLVAGADAGEIMRQLGNSGLALPYTVLIDGAGKVRYTHLGRVSERELDALLDELSVEN